MPVRRGKHPVVAVDIGGTKILAAAISAQGEIVAREYVATCAEGGPKTVTSKILAAIDQVICGANIPCSQVGAVVLAIAGALDVKRGLVTVSPNLAGWQDVPLADIIHSATGLSTLLINDANAAALGEHLFGAGRGTRNMIFITVSTGIGGGLILEDRLYTGASGAAGEVGHMTIEVNGPPCNCGNKGCLEALASGGAIAREAVKHLRQGERSLLSNLVEGDWEKITAQTVHLAAQQGDPLSLEIIHRAAIFLGVGLANLVNIFNPEKIVVGGGVARMGDMLLEPARKVVAERAFPLLVQAASIVSSQLGDNAGVMGAAAFAWEMENREVSR